MPIHKNAFHSCNFDKNLYWKNTHNGGGQRLEKKLKSVLDTVKNVVHNADIWENTKISFFQIE